MQRWNGKATFVGVAWSGNEAEFQTFIDEHGLTFPQISDPSGEVFARFSVSSQPAFAVVDPSGNVSQLFGAADPATLDSVIQQAIDGA